MRENLTLLHTNNKGADQQSDQHLCYSPSGKYTCTVNGVARSLKKFCTTKGDDLIKQ